jgi:hypothetical protein
LGYKLIILRVHAGINEGLGNSTFLFTSENYSQQRYAEEQLTDQIRPGVINLQEKDNPVFSIGPAFFLNSMKGNFQGTTIVISSCYGLHNDLLAKALVAKGTSSVIGWENLVSLDHTDRAAMLLSKYLLEDGLTVKEAVDRVTAEVGKDSSGSSLEYYP